MYTFVRRKVDAVYSKCRVLHTILFMNIIWNADTYAKDFSFVHQYGNGVLELIDTSNAKTAIDLGCGSGALSGKLRDMGFDVTGIDSSPEQLAIARRDFPDINFIEADVVSFKVEKPADVIFSNAVFHWIDKDKQLDMLHSINASLANGGQLVFEMGGYGNNKLIHRELRKAFERHDLEYRMPFFFPSIGEYSAMIEKEGMLVTYAVLFDRPTALKGDDGMASWISMFIRTPFEGVDEETENEIIDEAVKNLRNDLFKDGIWYSDYVRLRMKAIKP